MYGKTVDNRTEHPYKNPMNYVDSIIKDFGGIRPMARELELPPTTISYWKQVGHIPSPRQQRVMDAGKNLGISITPDRFFDEAAA